MNKELILQVADAIEQHTIPWLGFNMGPLVLKVSGGGERYYTTDQSGHSCGTVACIAGWTLALQGHITESMSDSDEVGLGVSEAAEFLGLEGRKAFELFFAYTFPGSRGKITAAHAVRVLRHLAETGAVDWRV